MRTVVRNSFARNSILAERVTVPNTGNLHGAPSQTCAWCGNTRGTIAAPWLYRFWLEPERPVQTPIADGRLFCSRACCESFTGQSFDETKRG